MSGATRTDREATTPETQLDPDIFKLTTKYRNNGMESLLPAYFELLFQARMYAHMSVHGSKPSCADDLLKPTCTACFLNAEDIQALGRGYGSLKECSCGYAQYCSDECKEAHAPFHAASHAEVFPPRLSSTLEALERLCSDKLAFERHQQVIAKARLPDGGCLNVDGLIRIAPPYATGTTENLCLSTHPKEDRVLYTVSSAALHLLSRLEVKTPLPPPVSFVKTCRPCSFEFVTGAVLRQYQELPVYQRLRDAGQLIPRSQLVKNQPIVFVSHRWSARDVPDRDELILQQIKALHNTTQKFYLVVDTECEGESGFLCTRDVDFNDDTLYWIDYCCLPQRVNGQPRSAQDQTLFDASLANMNTLFSDYLVVLGIYKEKNDYVDRAWCKYELTLASSLGAYCQGLEQKIQCYTPMELKKIDGAMTELPMTPFVVKSSPYKIGIQDYVQDVKNVVETEFAACQALEKFDVDDIKKLMVAAFCSLHTTNPVVEEIVWSTDLLLQVCDLHSLLLRNWGKSYEPLTLTKRHRCPLCGNTKPNTTCPHCH